MAQIKPANSLATATTTLRGILPLANICEDYNEWDLEVDELANAILWDRDYEDGDIYMDHPPEKTEWLNYMARIPDNYYTAIADDLTDEEAQVKIEELRKLCNSVIDK